MSCSHNAARLAALLLPLLAAGPLPAQNSLGPGEPAWLADLPVRSATVFPGGVPDTIVALGHSELEDSAAREIGARLAWVCFAREPRVVATAGNTKQAVVIGTQAEIEASQPHAKNSAPLAPEAYRLYRSAGTLFVEGGDTRGVLYGSFALLRLIAEEHPLPALDVSSTPAASIRWTNEWDNSDGSIERGYAGPSIFFAGGKVRADLSRAAAYARLLSSGGINGCTINNVNANIDLLQPANLADIARIANVFRPYGVRVSLSVDMSSPQAIGGLKTFDLLDSQVAAWWKSKIDETHRVIPDFGGVLIKG